MSLNMKLSKFKLRLKNTQAKSHLDNTIQVIIFEHQTEPRDVLVPKLMQGAVATHSGWHPDCASHLLVAPRRRVLYEWFEIPPGKTRHDP